MSMQFRKAERKRSKLRLGISGPSGSGKTYGALLIAKGFGGRVAVIDTEEGSASLYSHLCEFDALELRAPYTPERYIEAIQTAERAGYDLLVIDSITHEWSGKGGCLEINDTTAHASFKGNTWAAWNKTTPRHRAFLDAILQSKCHIIATMRSKVETVQEGRQVIKLGLKEEQRDGTEYEFTTVLSVTHANHHATASKDRTGLFSDPHLITPDTGRRLRDWLESGVEVKPEPTPVQELANRHLSYMVTPEQLERLASARAEWLKSLGVDPSDKEKSGIEWRGKLHFYGVQSATQLQPEVAETLIAELLGNATPKQDSATDDFPA
jgi:hypothetical protein